jgi:predicted nucleic acid-binding protein
MSNYVLDTSALLTFIENEEGVEKKVEELFNEALEGNIELFISVISCIEIFYISWQQQGKKVASERLELIDDLIITQEPLTQQPTRIIGEIKANNDLSLADCCIVGLAKLKQAILVHKDPEFEQVEEEIKQLKLPYKQREKHRRGKVK